MTHFVSDSEVVKSTSHKNHHIFEAEFMASESLFDHTAFFSYYLCMLQLNPNSENSLIFLFFNSSKLFPFRFLFGYAYSNSIRAVYDISQRTL